MDTKASEEEFKKYRGRVEQMYATKLDIRKCMTTFEDYSKKEEHERLHLDLLKFKQKIGKPERLNMHLDEDFKRINKTLSVENVEKSIFDAEIKVINENIAHIRVNSLKCLNFFRVHQKKNS